MAESYSLSFHTVGGATKPEGQLETGYYVQKTIMMITIPICTLGLLGNGIVLWFLGWRIRKTNFTVYFLNMAIADLTVLFYYITAFILFLKAVPISLYYLHIIELVHAFGFNASTYLLTAIAAERYLMVFFPVWYQHSRPKLLSEFMCIILWGLSGLMSLVLYFACYLQYDSSLTEGKLGCEPSKLFRVIFNLLVCLPIMVFSTLILFIRMLRTSQQIPVAKLDITIVATVLLFVLFAASVRIIDILAHWVPSIHVPVLFLILHFLDSIDSSANPFVYLFVGYTKEKVAGENAIQTYLERALLDDGNATIDGGNTRITWASGTK
ncbi:proto-oncogene Mas-like [Rhineura floridana]|uniref:proto-oncogene Mas-like n=1 Tax=Rhineura floridana TaxID=261503 RepID=UPI002AC86877|nr:proto-oncogene Mas-like [Rhineura floridana]